MTSEVHSESNCVVVSITTRNQLYRTRVLMRGVAEFLPRARRVVYCADPLHGSFDPACEDFEPISVTELGLPRFRQFAFTLSATALCCALKPQIALHALRKFAPSTLIYFDNDIALYRTPTELLALASDHDLVLTPHLLEPLPDGATPDHGTIRNCGTFNAGVIGVCNTPASQGFLRWWATMVSDPRNLRMESGYDQCWLDLAPSFIEHFAVLRHPGYNVAAWNLPSRALTQDDCLRAGGVPLTLFHFSCFNEAEPKRLVLAHTSSYEPTPVVSRLAEDYARRLMTAGATVCKTWPYGFARKQNGELIIPAERNAVARLPSELVPIECDFFDPTWHEKYPALWNQVNALAANKAALPRRVLNSVRTLFGSSAAAENIPARQ